MGFVACEAAFPLVCVVRINEGAPEFLVAALASLFHAASFLKPHRFRAVGIMAGGTGHETSLDGVVGFLAESQANPRMAVPTAFLDV